MGILSPYLDTTTAVVISRDMEKPNRDFSRLPGDPQKHLKVAALACIASRPATHTILYLAGVIPVVPAATAHEVENGALRAGGGGSGRASASAVDTINGRVCGAGQDIKGPLK